MKLRWAALSLVLALCALVPHTADAQAGEPQPGRRRVGTLGQNYPNPFNPETWIPFGVDTLCTEPNRQYRVTMRIHNTLTQVVAMPELVGGSGTATGGSRLENLVLTCGKYTAYWDGKFLNTNRDVASGVYIYRLDVDGKFEMMRKFLVTK